MTAEIGEQQRLRALRAPLPEDRPTRLGRMIIGITCFGVGATITGLVLAGLDIALTNANLAVYAAACFVLAGLASALLVLRAMFADCQEFYRRGQLEGWHRGWNGQPPETSDPLLR